LSAVDLAHGLSAGTAIVAKEWTAVLYAAFVDAEL